MSLTVIITTKNEEVNIKRAITSADFADEILVIDDYSTDQTAQIAEQAGATVIKNSWKGYGQQKNSGIKHASGDWLFFLDADEEISKQLKQEILATINNPAYTVYWVRVIDIFLGKPLNHLTGNNPRLVKRVVAQWTERPVHEQVQLNNCNTPITLGDTHSGRLNAHIIHHSHSSIRSYLKKMHRYTSLDARQMRESGTHRSGKKVSPSFILPLYLALRQLVKLWLYRGGIKDGYAGTVWSLLSAYYEWEMGKKYLKLAQP